MIQLQDNALSQNDHERLYKFITCKSFIRHEKDVPDQPDEEATYTYNFLNNEKELITSTLLGILDLPENLQVARVYANAFHFGDTPRFHTDSSNQDSRTLLYYPNLIWKPMWGGETVFQDPNYGDDSGIYQSVAPVPNRLIAFPGTILHTARPPLYQHLIRYSIAIKLEPMRYTKPRFIPIV